MKNNKKGFTLAELLIVIAIMAILIAIAIPVFSSQMENARHAVDTNAERSAKSMAESHFLLEHVTGDNEATSIECTFTKDNDGNLEILACTATGPASNKCTFAGKSGTEISPESKGCSDANCPFGKSLKVTVDSTGKVSGGWTTTTP